MRGLEEGYHRPAGGKAEGFGAILGDDGGQLVSTFQGHFHLGIDRTVSDRFDGAFQAVAGVIK